MHQTLALLALAAVAADPAPGPPKAWEKLAETKYAHSFLFVQDGYTAGIGAEIVKGTEQNRAQSFTYTLYRYKLGDKEPRILDRRVSTHWLVGDLGPGGAVVTGWFANADTIHLPDHKPLSLPKEKVRWAAKRFTADGLLCYGELYADDKYRHEIVLFPINRRLGEIGDAKVLRKWFVPGGGGFTLDFSHGNLHARGDYLVYDGQVPNAARPGFPDRGIETWDVRNEKVVWREAHASVEAADDTHAYWTRGSGVIARRALDGKTRAEQFALPKGTRRIELHPPFVLAFVEKDKTDDAAVFDLRTGECREFGLSRSRATQQAPGGDHFMRHSAWSVPPPGGSPKGPLVAFRMDPTTGEMRAAYNGALYKVPPTSRDTPKDKPKWEPLPEEKK